MSKSCLARAKVGDIARVCFKPYEFYGFSYMPTNEISGIQFDFPIIDISEHTGYYPQIGLDIKHKNIYSFSNPGSSSRWLNIYSGTYYLDPDDIKTIKIYKAK